MKIEFIHNEQDEVKPTFDMIYDTTKIVLTRLFYVAIGAALVLCYFTAIKWGWL
jgi:hypothetical protein